MSCQNTLILPPIVAGETWDGFSMSLTSDGTSLAEDLANVNLVFRDSTGVVALTLTSAGASPGITITDANAWAFTVAKITPFPLTAGTYTTTIEFTNASGDIRKWFKTQLSILEN